MEKLKVNKAACISCGSCAGMYPDLFAFGDDDTAEVIMDTIPEDREEDVTIAIEGCPTGAIGYEEEKVA